VLALASQTYTAPQIVAFLESLLAAVSLVSTSKTTWHDAVVANAKLEVQYAPLVTELKPIISNMYSNAETTLVQFGLTPKKPRKPLTTEQLAARAAKAAATRKARGTTSKKQKDTISGNVTGVTIVPVTGASGTSTGSTPSTATAASVASATPAAPVTPAPAAAATPVASTQASGSVTSSSDVPVGAAIVKSTGSPFRFSITTLRAQTVCLDYPPPTFCSVPVERADQQRAAC
jgi:hypothetical protein